jgi:hypothetical protein
VTCFLFLATLVALSGPSNPVAVPGSIRGVVVNASRDMRPVPGAEIVLRVRLDGEFVVAAEGVADELGRFVFDDIPADSGYIYLPGANCEGIHYPGPRVQLSSQMPHARLTLKVHDTVSDPSPLVIRRCDIAIQPETDALRVTETLLIENPGAETYVGIPAREGGRAATLRLSIPSDFRRTTFQNEFYGSQFTLIDGKLVTDIPWTPGQRELVFTYVLPNNDRQRVWERPLDLPCDRLHIDVHTDTPGEVSCNLSPAAGENNSTVGFESKGETLPAGHVVRIQLGRLPVSLAAYGRWIALALLGALMAIAGCVSIFCHRKKPLIPGDQHTSVARRKAA